MTYDKIKPAKFLARPNRFIAHVELDGEVEICHVKNTGRCKELLISGAEIYVQESSNPERKTKYDLISVRKASRLINMDSQIPNKVFAEWVRTSGYFGEQICIKPETTYGNSRLDFYIEAGKRKIFAEVKGVTLEEDGIAMFPDAPTERGIKHLHELCKCVSEGYEAVAVFIIQMNNIRYFTPNYMTHAAFGEALKEAKAAGVQIIALDCTVTENSITAGNFVEIRL